MTMARELAIRGLSVTLFDKGKLGRESSWAAGGILSSMRPWSEDPYSSELSNLGKECYAEFVDELQQQTGIDSEYYQSGLLMINAMDVEQLKQWADENQVLIAENYEDYPSNMRIPATSIFLPEIAQVRVSRLLKALHASLIQLGVTIFENTEITGLEINNARCTSVMTRSKKYYADSFIEILGSVNEDIKIKPVMGEMLCVKFPRQQLETMVLDGGHYFIPRRDGHVLIGSTMEDVGFKKETTPSARNELMEWACALWPDIVDAEFVKHWSGLRPATDNGKPYLGKLEECENIFINAGHFRKGIIQAPICARNIADMVC